MRSVRKGGRRTRDEAEIEEVKEEEAKRRKRKRKQGEAGEEEGIISDDVTGLVTKQDFC